MTARIRPRFYSTAQVKQHETPSDLWMIIYNKVYDVSKFVDSHPGGAEVLIDCGGVDATGPFEDVGHSADALAMLAPYFVGDLDPQEHRSYSNSACGQAGITDEQPVPKNNTGFKLFMEKFTLVVLMLLMVSAVVLYYYTQKFKWSYHNL